GEQLVVFNTKSPRNAPREEFKHYRHLTGTLVHPRSPIVSNRRHDSNGTPMAASSGDGRVCGPERAVPPPTRCREANPVSSGGKVHCLRSERDRRMARGQQAGRRVVTEESDTARYVAGRERVLGLRHWVPEHAHGAAARLMEVLGGRRNARDWT